MRFFKTESYIVLKKTLIVLAIVVAVSQVGLIIEGTRHYFTAVDILDGAIPVSGNVAKSGELKLLLHEGKPSEKIIVLINGDEYSTFDQEEMTIPITNQSVVEILNNSGKKIKVSVTNISDNLTCTYMAPDTVVDNISVLCRVIFRQ